MVNVKVSVIIPTYGREDDLCNTLRQLFDQVFQPHEILVIDQTPQHLAETDRFLAQAAAEGRVRLIRLETPGLAGARNCGILEADGDVLIFLDDDVLIDRGFVGAHVANFTDPAVAAVTGAVWSEKGIPLPVFEEFPPKTLTDPLGWMEVPPNLGFKTEKILLIGGNFSVRRSLAVEVGGFDYNFGRYDYHGDYDFGWRIHRAGGKILHEPLAGIHHLASPRGGCRIQRKRRLVPDVDELQPKFYFFLKHFPDRRSLIPLLRLMRQQVVNRANLLRPHFLVLSMVHAVVAFQKAFVDAVFTGERGLKKEQAESVGNRPVPVQRTPGA